MSQKTTLSTFKYQLRYNFDSYLPLGWSPPPPTVHIIPTYRCNLKCKMCYQRDDKGKTRLELDDTDLTLVQWKQVIDKIVGFAPNTHWYGGEVMIYPEMLELFTYACAKGLNVTISTNGVNLAKNATKLVEMGVKTVVVSLDGLADVHNTIRRHPYAFAWAVDGIKAIFKARQAKGSSYPQVTLSYTITKQNYHQLIDVYRLAQNLGVDEVNYVGLIYLAQDTIKQHSQVMQAEFGLSPEKMNVISNEDSLEVDGEALQKQVNALLNNIVTTPPVKFWSKGLEHNLATHYGSDQTFPLHHHRCFSIWHHLVIQPNGDVTACPFLLEVVTGNVLQQDLFAIWNNALFRKFRQRVRKKLFPGCTRCSYSQYCGPKR